MDTEPSPPVADSGSIIVLDNGSGTVKAGFSGDDEPRVSFRSVVGRPKGNIWSIYDNDPRKAFIGDDAQQRRAMLVLKQPMEYGSVQNWDDLERLWHYIFFEKLQIAPENHPVMLTEAIFTPRNTREHLAGLLFETFNVPCVSMGVQPSLALTATGKVNGCVVDCGDGVSHVVPIYENYPFSYHSARIDIGGRDLTDYMVRMLYEVGEGQNFDTTSGRAIAKKIKEELSFVALDWEAECNKYAAEGEAPKAEEYELPDGTILPMAYQRFYCPEALFEPKYIGKYDTPGLHEAVRKCVEGIEMELRPELYKNVLLAGGVTLTKGLPQRLKRELEKLCGDRTQVGVTEEEKRDILVFKGGSITTSMEGYAENYMVEKEVYEEYGARCIHPHDPNTDGYAEQQQ